MSLCTPHDRTAGAPGTHVPTAVRLAGGAGPAATPPRMFKPPEWEWTGFGEVGWWVRSGSPWRDILLGPAGLRLDEWRASGSLATVKSGPHRIVYRVALPEGTLYIKHYLVPNRRAILRQWFRRGKGRNEGKRSQALAATGVPTIWTIALGEQRKRNFLFENYLVTLEIADSIPLDEFVMDQLPEWPEPRRSRVRHKLAMALGAMTARLHDAGFLHVDFHPGNVLVRFTDPNEPDLVILDLDALRLRRRVDWKTARQNLALLNHFFWVRSTRTDRLRFLEHYRRYRRGPVKETRRAARQIEGATRAWAERLWRRWGRRCRSSNKYFESATRDDAWGVASRELDPDAFRRIMDDPDGPFRDPASRPLKDSRTTRVAETTMIVRGRPTAIIYKRFNRKKWLDPVLNLFRPSRAWRSWQAGQDLVSRGIPTPKNLAYLERRPYGKSRFLRFLSHETYLVTVKEEPAVDLATYVNEVLPALPADLRRSRLRRLTVSLAKLIRSLHDRSLSHRDLKSANILIRTDTIDAEDRLSLIDLVGVRLRHPLPWGRRVQNLARLGISLESAPGRTRTDALRFLRLYLPWGLSPLNDWKSFWRSIERAMRAKRSRNLRRGRPLS
jgi:tRNA A-37 threonylcarbamoyl transferase component Bud32